MTLLGKIFTVLVLVMSVVFMSFAITVYATHQNWNTLVDNPTPAAGKPLGLKQRVEQQRETNERLRAELEQALASLAAEQAARRHVLANLYSRLSQLQQELSGKERQLADLQAAHVVATQTAQSTQSTLVALTGEVGNLRAEIKSVVEDRNQKFDRLVALTDVLNQTQGLYDNMVEKRDQLAFQVTRMKGVMDKYGIDENTPTDLRPPQLDGLVVAIGADQLIEISIGSDDGLRKGHELDVYRGGNYLGRVRIMSTDPDRAVASIIKKYERGKIRKDDRVSTRFNFG